MDTEYKRYLFEPLHLGTLAMKMLLFVDAING